MTIKMKPSPDLDDLNRSIIVRQSLDTAILAHYCSSHTAETSGSNIMARTDYLKAKLAACYAKTAELPITHRLLAVAAAACDAVELGFRQPLTIPKSLVAADNAFKRLTKTETLVLSVVAYSLWYTASSITEFVTSSVTQLCAIPDKLQFIHQLWHDTLATGFPHVADVLRFISTVFLVLALFVAIVELVRYVNAEPSTSTPTPVSKKPTNTLVPLVGGHFKKPPGARYVKRPATNPVQTENQQNIPTTSTSASRGSRRRSSDVCGRSARECREIKRQFDHLLEADETLDNEKRRDMAAIRIASKGKDREIERLSAELSRTTQELNKTAQSITELQRDLATMTEELNEMEEIAGPESTAMVNNLKKTIETKDTELAASKQENEMLKQRVEVILDDSKAYQERIDEDIELCQATQNLIIEKLTGKYLIARSEANEVYLVRKEVNEWREKHREQSQARYEAEKRAVDALKRREYCYVRMKKAEDKLRELEVEAA